MNKDDVDDEENIDDEIDGKDDDYLGRGYGEMNCGRLGQSSIEDKKIPL